MVQLLAIVVQLEMVIVHTQAANVQFAIGQQQKRLVKIGNQFRVLKENGAYQQKKSFLLGAVIFQLFKDIKEKMV